MKPTSTWTRNKPPHGRQGGYKSNHVNEAIIAGMEGSRSEKSGERPGMSMVTIGTPKDVSDCISSWLAYLQMLNGLCSAGSRLSQCLCGLAQENHVVASHCQAMWEELVRSSTVASSNIKSNVLTSLQQLNLADNDPEQSKILATSQAISNSLAAFIHLQYQFSAACCECLSPILGCPCPPGDKHEGDCSAEAMQQAFQRLFPPPQPSRGARSPLPITLAPFIGSQRRWSEAAAQDVSSSSSGTDAEGTMRRWSMPWETSKGSDQQPAWPGSRLTPKSKLTVPGSLDRSRSTTPESAWQSSMASNEELQEVIQLLSCPVPGNAHRGIHSVGGKPHLPGVVLTSCGFDPSQSETWSEGTTPGSRRGSNSPHRGPQWSGQEITSHTWSEGEAQTPSGGDGNYELSPATLDPSALASRKSSSSTDSSSSYSLHSRSTTGSISAGSTSDGPQEARTHLYSMWSGSELPFIKLPESNEVIEETPTDVQHNFFMSKPSH